MIEIYDGRGIKVITSGSVRRIVSLAPSSTEMVFCLGLGEMLAGVTHQCDYPPEAAGVRKVGDFALPDVELITSLGPDLVLAESSMHQAVISDLAKRGIAVYGSSPGSLDQVLQMMEDVSALAGRAEEGKGAAGQLRGRLDNLRRNPVPARPGVFRLLADQPVISPGPASFQYDAIDIAGGQQMIFPGGTVYTAVAWEELVSFNPGVILFCGLADGEKTVKRCRGCTVDNPPCKRRAGDLFKGHWRELAAVRSGRVYPTPCHMLCRPGPRLIDGIEKLHGILKKM